MPRHKTTHRTRRLPPWPAPRPRPPRQGDRASTAPDYLKKILTARVYDVAIEIAAGTCRAACRAASATRLLKREDQQPVFSFKLRGAYNKMAHLSADAAGQAA
jgi:threonine dehydratase